MKTDKFINPEYDLGETWLLYTTTEGGDLHVISFQNGQSTTDQNLYQFNLAKTRGYLEVKYADTLPKKILVNSILYVKTERSWDFGLDKINEENGFQSTQTLGRWLSRNGSKN